MKIGYMDLNESSFYKIKSGSSFTDGILSINKRNDFSEIIDLREIFHKYEVDNTLEKILIYGNEQELINMHILSNFPRLKEIFFKNIQLENLEWLVFQSKIEFFTLSSTDFLGNEVMIGSFYHPLKYLTNLEYLDLSFSNFSNNAIYISDVKSIFDDMISLKYLNLRETNINNDSFFLLLKSENLLVNFTDNILKLNFSKYNNIRLVTKIKVGNGSIMDISNYIGK